MEKYIVIVEATTSGAGLQIIKAAIEVNKNVIFITNDKEKYKDDVNNPLFKKIQLVHCPNPSHYSTLHETIEGLKSNVNIEGIISLSDGCIEAVSLVAKENHLTFINSDVVKVCRNKELTRRKLRSIVKMPKYQVITSFKQAVGVSENWGFPIILKDSRGTGSMNVYLCRDEKELTEYYHEISTQIRDKQNSKILIEEYIVGTLVSVEAITYNYNTSVIGITNRTLGRVPYFVEQAYDFPYKLSEPLNNELIDIHSKVVKELNINVGPTHTEFLIAKDGIYLVEVNPRLGGGLLGKMISDSLDYDIYKEIVNISINKARYKEYKVVKGASTYVLYPEKEGVNTRIDDSLAIKVPYIQEIKIKNLEKNHVMLPKDFKGDLGYIYAVSGSAPEARLACETASSQLKIVYDQFSH
ncbi:ATP-grasp domain-containing protein [Aquibacillus sp. 3ASR75-11]|uniref:ATP-grasp domain-containing protein n=1 Tax=Terrihalobacillus insolitus TaxID=2950438 RepID=A0A9X3WV35_9BACI|nr:ATP-grasp domain-containing protein [Terrihalobacillus insolitus]MDC3412993.1 ATP-grasp domain-containing protein [Terrihalobacillus insolitus]MDC3426302.1 ATP-grasp domain-containing protein [Terrihalobacillus insolitus]